VSDAALEGGIRDILEHVGAHDEIVASAQLETGELLEAAESDVATTAVACDDPFAGVDAEVAEARSHAPQLPAPHTLSGSDIEDGPELATEKILGDPGHHAYLPTNGIR
jgi:hypothetical protein